jgi:ADP-ribosylglycohydrolase
MRAAQVGLLFPAEQHTRRIAAEQSRITHLDSRCAAGAVAVARAASLAATRNSIEADTFLEEIAASAEQEDSAMGAAIRSLLAWVTLEPAAAARRLHESNLDPGRSGWRGISAFVIPSVCWSLYAFVRSPEDYWETVCTAIEVGGDTDTLAAMAGGMSGAHLGLAALPQALLTRLTDRGSWGAEALIRLARSCAGIASGGGGRRG